MWKVSVITITYNNAENLAKTLEALLQQDYENLESIIIDGGSTDNSVEIIKNFEKKFKGTVKWKSEKDRGMYEAINKGIKMATGEIIGCYWDIYASSDVITKIVKTIERDGTDGVHGDLLYIDGNKVKRYWKMGKGRIQNGWMPGHPTLYLKKEVYDKYGLYSEKYKYSWDYEFIIRILKDDKVKLSYIPEILIYMFYGGTTTSGVQAYKKSIMDSIKSLEENHIRFPRIITLKRFIRTAFQFINYKNIQVDIENKE